MRDDSTPDAPQQNRLPWRPHWCNDHARLVKGWPSAARTALVELLDHQWNFGALPDNQDRLRTIADLTAREWGVAWRFVESEFPLDADGFRRNPALGELYAAQQVKQAKSSVDGKKGALIRWGKPR